MTALSSSEFLPLWERGQRLHPLDRGLLALQAASPGVSWDELAGLPLGQRNRGLFELRSACFGPAMSAWVACPQCGEKLEFELDARSLASAAGGPAEPVTFEGETFRLPTSRDLALAARERDPRRAALRLLESCRINPSGNTMEWSGEQMEAVGEQLAAADPLAETRLSLACSSCGHAWDEALDVAAFLWAEIEVQVRRLFDEVHVLASAYHWPEAAILSLSERRRAIYLEMVRA